MKLEEFEVGIDEAIYELVDSEAFYSCSAIYLSLGIQFAILYTQTLQPNIEGNWSNWLEEAFNWNESKEFYMEMRLTMILLFEQYCISEQLYLEF